MDKSHPLSTLMVVWSLEVDNVTPYPRLGEERGRDTGLRLLN